MEISYLRKKKNTDVRMTGAVAAVVALLLGLSAPNKSIASTYPQYEASSQSDAAFNDPYVGLSYQDGDSASSGGFVTTPIFNLSTNAYSSAIPGDSSISSGSATVTANQVEVSAQATGYYFADKSFQEASDNTAGYAADLVTFNAPVGQPWLNGTSVAVTGNINVNAQFSGNPDTIQYGGVGLFLYQGTSTSDSLTYVSDYGFNTSGNFLVSNPLGDVTYGDTYLVELYALASVNVSNGTATADLTDPSAYFTGLAPGSTVTGESGASYDAPAPESSTEISFGILLALGAGMLVMARRKQTNS